MADSSPLLHRPIPRRLHDPNPVASFEHVSSPPSPSPEDTNPCHSSYSTMSSGISGFETPSYLRTASSINLTSSTLFGIYGNEPDTPSCLSSRRQSPVSSLHTSPSVASFNELGEGRISSRVPSSYIRENPSVSSIILRRGRSSPNVSKTNEKKPRGISIWQLIWRAGLLFSIGSGYGLMVAHLQNEGDQDLQGGGMYVEKILRSARAAENYNWTYLTIWGLAGVGFGSLLPWLDGVWEETHPELATSIDRKGRKTQMAKPKSKERQVLAADWNVVVRSIGVFVGIAFAIRKLPWTSTLQVSIALTLINPMLWYLVDRTLSGLLFSSSIGTIGTFFLLLLNPSIMPPPLSLFTSPSSSTPTAFPSAIPTPHATANSSKWDWILIAPDGILKTGVLDAQMVEIGIWLGSVLFCSAVCFGGIGRRLAIRRTE